MKEIETPSVLLHFSRRFCTAHGRCLESSSPGLIVRDSCDPARVGTSIEQWSDGD